MTNQTAKTGEVPDRIDSASIRSLDQWAAKLQVSHEQLKEAIAAVGSLASDVEMHLKGSRSTTTADQVHKAG